MSRQTSAYRYVVGQRVKITANNGGLYSAQIGVVGVIWPQRSARRHGGYHCYDVAYRNEKGAERAVIVREDDLEATDAPIAPEQPPTAKVIKPSGAQFAIGERVIVTPADNAIYEHSTGADAVGVIEHVGRSLRVRTYEVRFTRPATGWRDDPDATQPLARTFTVHEDHLAWAPTPDEQPTPQPATEPSPAPMSPLFAIGNRVIVHPRSELAYDAFTRKGAVGVVTGVGQPVRGIRRYDVRYSGTEAARAAAQRDALGLLPVAQIREEHLLPAPVKADAPAEPVTPVAEKPRHACDYRAEWRTKGVRVVEPLWCDKGGCFEDDCVVCQQTPEWRVRHGLKPPQRLRRHESHQPLAPESSAPTPEQMSLWGSEAAR